MRFTFFFILFTATLCHLACQDTTKNKNSEKVGDNKTTLQDTSGITIRGDSISYINWASENEILGLANTGDIIFLYSVLGIGILSFGIAFLLKKNI